jgi:hypothetical protein
MHADEPARIPGRGRAAARACRRGSQALALVALATMAATACGPRPGTHTAARPSPGRRPPCASPVAASDNANGRAVHLCLGQAIVLRLHSTYWEQITSSDQSVLRQSGPTRIHLAPTSACVPGAGCGTLTTRFLAAARGTARITARRRLCGEDVECSPSQQGFTLTVIVR